MIVIGIYDDHNCSAALSIDGKIVFAAQEERFTRVKHDASFPKNSISYCLNEAGIEANQLAIEHSVIFTDFVNLIDNALKSIIFISYVK